MIFVRRINEWIEDYVDLYGGDELEEEEEETYVFMIDFAKLDIGQGITIKRLEISDDHMSVVSDKGFVVLHGYNNINNLINSDKPFLNEWNRIIIFTNNTDKNRLIDTIKTLLRRTRISISNKLRNRTIKLNNTISDVRRLKNRKDIFSKLTTSGIIDEVNKVINFTSETPLNEWAKNYKQLEDEIEVGYEEDDSDYIFAIDIGGLLGNDIVKILKVTKENGIYRVDAPFLYNNFIDRLLKIEPKSPIYSYNNWIIYFSSDVDMGILYTMVKNNISHFRRSVSGTLQSRIRSLRQLIQDVRMLRRSKMYLKDITPLKLLDKISTVETF